MPESVKVQRRREQRKQHRSDVRQGLFVVDYIYNKYPDIHSEAAEFYNAVNTRYPTKHDLRKTAEYKVWKIHIKGQQIPKRERPNPVHPNIEPIPFQIRPRAQIDVIGTGEPQPSGPSPSEGPSAPDTGEPQPSGPSPSEGPSAPDTGEPQPPVYADNLQLRIPLRRYKSKTTTKRCTDTTETVQTVTEEDIIHPSMLEEISPELIEKVIEELRSEPCLKDIFTNIEQQLEFEQLGMDIDVDIEDNALDIELGQW